MMKKRVISIVVLLAFLTAGFIYLNKVFASDHHYVNTTEDFKTLSKKVNIDVIIYGSSHAYTAYNPLIINDICKTISYNLGSDGLKISLTDLVLNESLKYTRPKLIVLEVYPPSLQPVTGDADKGYHLRAMDFASNFSLLKFKKTINIYDLNEYLGVYFPLIRNHSNWNTFDYFNLNKRKMLDFEKNFFYGGFLGSLNIMNETDKKILADFKSKPKILEASNPWLKEDSKKYIKDFVELAKESGAKVLIISSPDPRARVQFNYYFYQEIKDLSTSLDVSFLNLNDYYEEMKIELDDFKDNSHLNTSGSIKATKFLAEYIKENYKLADRSSEMIWKEESQKYDAFKEEYSEIEKKYFLSEINKNLSKDLFINSLTIKRVNKSELLFNIALDTNKTVFKNLDQYRMGVHLYAEDDDLKSLNEASKLKKAKYDQANIVLSTQKGSLNLKLETKVKHIKKIEIFLFNAAGYDGIIGDRVVIDNVIFKSEANEN